MLVMLNKSYIKAHKRRLKSGVMVDVPAHYDKRVRKGVEHTPAHGHDLRHLDNKQRSLFDRMHAEQHFLHHYHGHALRKQIAKKEAKIKALHDEAKAHKDAGRHVEGTKAVNRALSLNAQRIRHQKTLADIEHRVDGLAEMKNKLVEGAGSVKDSTDDSHKHYADKVGARFKPRRKVLIVRDEKKRKSWISHRVFLELI
jgi:uncharacterized membrane protein YgaE (UPF0421/DUF939 family)